MEPNKTQSPRNTATIWERGWLEEGPERYQPGFLVTIFMHRIVIYAHLSHLGSLKALNFFQPCRLCSPWRPTCSLLKPLLDWPAPSTGCPQPNHVYTKPEVPCYATRDSPVTTMTHGEVDPWDTYSWRRAHTQNYIPSMDNLNRSITHEEFESVIWDYFTKKTSGSGTFTAVF